MPPTLIYCQGDNARAAEVARSCGWERGIRSDTYVQDACRPLYLLDIDWKRPDWARHLRVARAERPALAAAQDVERADQLVGALAQAEELAEWCGAVMVIPKAFEVADRIPGHVGGKPVILGYSVPTRYGGTSVPLWEFGRRPVHLLGGSPRAQRALCSYLNVQSADGNMTWKLAQRGLVYNRRGVASGNSLVTLDGCQWDGDMPYEALRRSLLNLREFWR